MTTSKYWERVSQGVCVECGRNKPIPGRRKCKSCSDKRQKYIAESRAFYISIKICPICHRNTLFGDETRCLECTVARENKVESRKPIDKIAMRTYQKAHYENCKKDRICPTCGGKTCYGYVRCPRCREKNRKYVAKKRFECIESMGVN